MRGGFELDHVFVCVADLEGSVKLLADRGLECGVRSVHAGQGTADAVFFFDNAYLELLNARDERELALPAARKLGLDRRLDWRKSGACPFGVAFRRTGPAAPAGPVFAHRLQRFCRSPNLGSQFVSQFFHRLSLRARRNFPFMEMRAIRAAR